MATRPNIILIFPDQHRGDVMGCVGNPAAKTPNLDRLASEGVTFSNCCTNSPLCMPARASLMNGQYVNTHGVWHNWNAADRHGPSHVRNLRDAGYHTAVIGKTHLYVHGAPGVNDTRDHVQQLYDWGYVDTHELTGPWASRRIDSPYTDYLAEKGLLEAHRDYIGHYLRGMRSGELRPWDEPPPPLAPEDHLDTYTGRTAAEWVRNYQGDKPFYLQVCFPGPHDPFDSPREYRAMYQPEDMPVGTMAKPAWPVSPQQDFVLRWSALDGMTRERRQLMSVFYYAKVTLIDHAIGMLLKALKEKGLLDNTWIVYTSDHGEMLGGHFMSHKIVFYEAALKIPCIIRPPGGTRGWQSGALTDQIDMAATLLDIGGASPLHDSDGLSLLPKLNAGPEAGDAQRHKEAVFSEVNLYSMVLTDRYKMAVHSLSREPLELYDMKNDPHELDNLVMDREYRQVREDLMQRHLNYLLGHLDQDRLKVFQDIVATGERGGRARG